MLLEVRSLTVLPMVRGGLMGSLAVPASRLRFAVDKCASVQAVRLVLWCAN